MWLLHQYPEVDGEIEYLEVEAQEKRGSGKWAFVRLVLKIMSGVRVMSQVRASAEDHHIHNL